ncbi:MAG: V-type ATP synthase subunit E [Planctomycetota bacterium]|jgi:vacuolar-type H+-ATPase subunit E/Vma4
MEAEQVVEKILSEARNEAEAIKRKADEKEVAEQKKFEAELTEYKKQTEALAKKAASDEKAHLLAGARMEIAKEYLAEKRKILDEIFAKAREELKGLPDDKYQEIMKKLILSAVETGDEEVIVDTNEKRIDQKFIQQVNHELGSEYQGKLRLSDERQDIGCGFILKRGKIKNNASLDVLLADAREALEIELAKEVFG